MANSIGAGFEAQACFSILKISVLRPCLEKRPFLLNVVTRGRTTSPSQQLHTDSINIPSLLSSHTAPVFWIFLFWSLFVTVRPNCWYDEWTADAWNFYDNINLYWFIDFDEQVISITSMTYASPVAIEWYFSFLLESEIQCLWHCQILSWAGALHQRE